MTLKLRWFLNCDYTKKKIITLFSAIHIFFFLVLFSQIRKIILKIYDKEYFTFIEGLIVWFVCEYT